MSVREPIGGQLAAQFLDWDQWPYVGGPVGCTEPCTHCMFTVRVCVCVVMLEATTGETGWLGMGATATKMTL